MVRLNPEPKVRRYAAIPKGAVTACFAPGQDYQGAIDALNEAGYGADRIDIFTGEAGAESLDMEGRHHNRVLRFFLAIEHAVVDDAYLYHRIDAFLRDGGTMIAVFTHGDREERAQAVDILKNNGGAEPVYWGKWVTETFS